MKGKSKELARPSGLLELPNELLMPILEELTTDQLVSMAFLSRRLHLLTLPIYLWRIRVLDDHAKHSSCNITLYTNSFSALPVLRKALFIDAVAHLTCEFPSTGATIIGEVLGLHRFVSRMSSVQEATLVFHGQYVRQTVVPLDEWKKVFESLLDMLLAKSCRIITLRHGDSPASAFIVKNEDSSSGSKKKKMFSKPLMGAIRAMHKPSSSTTFVKIKLKKPFLLLILLAERIKVFLPSSPTPTLTPFSPSLL